MLRRPAVAAVVVAAAICVVIAVWSSRGSDLGGTHAPVLPGAPVLAPRTSSLEPAAAATLAPASTATGPDRDDPRAVCGFANLRLTGDAQRDEQSVDNVLRPAAEAVKARLLESMLHSGDDRAAAAARMMLGAAWSFRSRVDPCSPGEDCEALKQRAADATLHREALAALATRTRDPQVYAWAVVACRATPAADSANCGSLSLEQWARLDPDNAAPWAEAAGRAKDTKDDATLAEAMHHVGVSKRHDVGWGVLTATILDQAPSDESSAALVSLLGIETIGIEAALPTSSWPAVIGWCSAKALADANHRETCARVADVLADRSRDMLGRQIGIGIGKRLGWPTDRLERMAQETLAYSATMTLAIEPGLGCAASERTRRHLVELGRHGEVGRAKRVIAESGRPLSAFVADYQAQLDRFAAQAASEAAREAASAGSAAGR